MLVTIAIHKIVTSSSQASHKFVKTGFSQHLENLENLEFEMTPGKVMEKSWNFSLTKSHGKVMEFLFFEQKVMEKSWNFYFLCYFIVSKIENAAKM